MNEKEKNWQPPVLTQEQIREALTEGEKRARKLDQRIRSTFAPTAANLSLVLR